MNFTTRQAGLTDEPFLWEMLYQALHVAAGQPPFPREILHQPEISRYLQGWIQPSDYGLLAVAKHTEQPLGAAWLRLFSSERKGYGYVDNATPELTIAVLPEHRGQGIGAALLTELFAHARSRYAALSLSVSADNPARRLYQRLGFAIVSATGSSLTMKKELV